jgi:uncharacterized protein YciI
MTTGDAMNTFVVFRKPGRAWVQGKGTRDQPEWDEHARFMDELHESGRVVLAGPYEDLSRVLLIVRAATPSDAEHLFDADPWAEMEILEMDGLHPWSPFLRPPGWPG